MRRMMRRRRRRRSFGPRRRGRAGKRRAVRPLRIGYRF